MKPIATVLLVILAGYLSAEAINHLFSHKIRTFIAIAIVFMWIYMAIGFFKDLEK